MAKKETTAKAAGKSAAAIPTPERGAKTKAVKEYLTAHKRAKPREVVAALQEQGIDVSSGMVSIIKAKLKVRKAKRRAQGAAGAGGGEHGQLQTAAAAIRPADKATGLDAALTLYKAAVTAGGDVSTGKVRQAFLSLVELLG